MNTSNSHSGKLAGASIFSAIAASLCCITPVLALISGVGGIASSFSWLESARPYLLGTSVLVLGFAWYQQLKPKPIDDCGCHVEQKTPFMQTKAFLGIVTAFSFTMMTFPSYTHLFFPKSESQTVVNTSAAIQKVAIKIEGMTCTGCEHHVKSEINKLKGITEVTVSYEKGNAVVSFDDKQVTVNDIINAINSTGYKAVTYNKIS